MGDNTQVLRPTAIPGGGGDIIATDDIGGVKFQRAKIALGADGVNDGDVSASNPMPVTGTVATGGLTNAELRAAAVPVSAASLPLPSGAATAANQQTNALTDAQLRATPVPVSGTLGSGDITLDAWGIQKMSLPYSLFHGMWTFDVPRWEWLVYENGAEVATSTRITSANGACNMQTTAGISTILLESRQCPRYQPNRGHLFSTALICPLKTNNGVREWGLQTANAGVFFRLKADGKLYAVIRSINVETYEQEIDTSGVTNFDVQKGNVYDIQYQWRGLGNYKFFINLQLVHTIANLGTLTALSMSNPALPAAFRATRTTQDVQMVIGCCDISSENGNNNIDTLGSTYAEAVTTNGADKPVLVIHNPLLINGLVNTRTVHVHQASVTNTKKCVFKIWRTRDASAITGATLVAGYGGAGTFVQSDSTNMNAGAVRATAVTVANLFFLDAVSVEPAVSQTVEISIEQHAPLHLVRGDYLIITTNAVNGSSDVIVRWGEEI